MNAKVNNTQAGAVAWTVVGPDGESSIGGWHDMRLYSWSAENATLRDGHRYAFAYTTPPAAVPVEDLVKLVERMTNAALETDDPMFESATLCWRSELTQLIKERSNG